VSRSPRASPRGPAVFKKAAGAITFAGGDAMDIRVKTYVTFLVAAAGDSEGVP
jgi:hypothetical protein